MFETLLPLPVASVNESAATTTVGVVPSEEGVQVEPYTVLEIVVKLESMQSVTVMSAITKLVVASLLVKIRTTSAVFVDPPLATVTEVIVIVGPLTSVTVIVTVSESRCVPSETVTEKIRLVADVDSGAVKEGCTEVLLESATVGPAV